MDTDESTRILLVEDEPHAANGLVRLFASCGFSTLVAGSVAETRKLLERWDENRCAYTFVDNRLSDGVGMDLVPELRELVPRPAVAIISNWMTSDLASRAFRDGAVPMAKPEDERMVRDLVALLDARKTGPLERAGTSSPPDPEESVITFGPFVLGQLELLTPSGQLRLRRTQRAILALLVDREGRPVSPQQIASGVLGRADNGAVRSVYSHVNSLRVALGQYAPLIETVPGAVGYRLALEIFER